jgi:nitrite reductase (NO-forming)
MGTGLNSRIAMLLVGALTLVACGGSDQSGGEIDLVGGETGDGEGVGFAFAGEEVTGEAPTITVQAGEEVTVNFKNVHGQYSNATANHDFAVVPQLDDIPTLAATRALDEEVLWESRTQEVPAGESATVAFVPEDPGDYYYVCMVPGHAGAGMIGEFIVTE